MCVIVGLGGAVSYMREALPPNTINASRVSESPMCCISGPIGI